MKRIVILGAGTSGTMMANHLNDHLHELRKEWEIVVIDSRELHYYQPGYLFLPFDLYAPEDVVRPIENFLPKDVVFFREEVQKILPQSHQVITGNGDTFHYDILIIASGTDIAPEETEGMAAQEWRRSIFDFYTYEGALALRDKLRVWEGGRLVVHITEMPIKCPVAPLEFAFLADSYFRHRRMREKVEITFVTPMSGPFTKPRATHALEHLLVEKEIHSVSDFGVERIDNEHKKLVDYTGREVPFDLLVTVPTNKGAAFIEASGMGDELNYVATHKGTLQSKVDPSIFVIGDASNIPASKAGSVAHFEAEILTENIIHYIKGEPLREEYDGHANCFVETGNGKAILLDFNYTHEPVEGTFPIPGVGPLRLLKESRMNHLGKLAFRWIYWNMLLKGTHLPFVGSAMTEAGKHYETT